MTFSKTDIAKIYIATFNRAPDTSGLNYWVYNSGFDKLEDVAKSFFDSAEAQQVYTSDKTTTELVELAYKNLFGREADSDGLAYWVGELDSGKIPQSAMLVALINGALGDDAVVLDNKTSVGISFADAFLEDIDLAKEIMTGVTADITSVDEAINKIKMDNVLTNDTTIASNLSHTATLTNISDFNTLGVDSLYSQSKWSSNTLTYSFNSTIPNDYYDFESENGSKKALVDGWQELNDSQKDATRLVFDDLEKIIDVKFQEVSSDGLIALNVVNMDAGTAGFSFYPGPNNVSYDGDLFLSSAFNTDTQSYSLKRGDFGYSTIVHEVGHAMGLKHPFEAPNQLPVNLDDINHSIMSYTNVHNYVPVVSFSDNKIFMDYNQLEPQSYSLYDVEALQAIYGANTTTNTEDNTYSIKFDDYKLQTIWDAGGVDTLDLSNTKGNSTISLKSGTLNSADIYSLDDVIKLYQQQAINSGKEQHNTWIAEQVTNLYNNNDLYLGQDNLGIAKGVVIENIYTGSGDDTITDNEVDNIIKTYGGNDKIYVGNGGVDLVEAGDGKDSLYLNISKDDVSSIVYDTDSYVLTSSEFQVRFNGVEDLHFSDGSIYTPEALV